MGNLKITPSLFIKGNKIISYDTEVAVIKDGKIYEKARYSRTTTRHIGHVASVLRLPIVHSTNKGSFYRYEMGEANCSMSDCFSVRTSTKILQAMGEGLIFIDALSTVSQYPPKDKELLYKYLYKNDIDVQGFEKLRKFNTVLKHIM
jgi:hypothetical protein